jgi:hypothetical protein
LRPNPRADEVFHSNSSGLFGLSFQILINVFAWEAIKLSPKIISQAFEFCIFHSPENPFSTIKTFYLCIAIGGYFFDGGDSDLPPYFLLLNKAVTQSHPIFLWQLPIMLPYPLTVSFFGEAKTEREEMLLPLIQY